MLAAQRLVIMRRAAVSGLSYSPTNLGSALKLWLDADDFATITFGAGSAVAAWHDKASSLSFAQATAGNRPTYSATGLNSKPTVTFVADNSDALKTASGPFIFDGPFSVFYVVKQTSISDYFPGILCGTVSTGEDPPALGYNNGSPSALDLSRAGSADQASSLTMTVGLAQIHGWVSAAGLPNAGTSLAATPYLDGTAGSLLTVAGFSNPIYTGLILGNTADISNPYNGAISEMICTNTALGTTDRQKVEGYLAWKWGTTANLPGGHPYKSVAP